MAHSLGVAMLGGNPLLGRNPADFYATPRDVTMAVLPRLGLRGPVAEPCCGDGAICRVLEEAGLRTVPTDLHDRGFGGHGGGHDVLAMEALAADEIVTNPPFNLAPLIIERVLPLRPRVMALLLKSSFWHAKSRTELFRRHRPSAVYALSWRPDFAALGAPTLELSWMVWDRDHSGPTVYDVLDRPPGFEVRAQRVRKAKPGLVVVAEQSLDAQAGAVAAA